MCSFSTILLVVSFIKKTSSLPFITYKKYILMTNETQQQGRITELLATNTLALLDPQ